MNRGYIMQPLFYCLAAFIGDFDETLAGGD